MALWTTSASPPSQPLEHVMAIWGDGTTLYIPPDWL